MIYKVLSASFPTHRNTGSANSVRYTGNVLQNLKKSYAMYVQEIMEGPPMELQLLFQIILTQIYQ